MYRSPSESRMFSHRALGRELAAHVTPLTFNDSGAIVVVDDNREAGAPKVAEAIALLHEALRLLTELDVAGLDRQDRLDLSHELARGRIRMDAIRSGVLAEVAAKKDWEDGPTRTLVELEERVSQEPRRESQ